VSEFRPLFIKSSSSLLDIEISFPLPSRLHTNDSLYIEIDPFYLAADTCQEFVAIHPFKAGNGRMGRLIANALLIKYAGIVIHIGENAKDKETYLKIADLARDGEMAEEARGQLARLFLEKGHKSLDKLKVYFGL